MLLLLLLGISGLLRSSGSGKLFNNARRDVEPLVNVLRDWLDFGTEFLFNAVEVESILVGDQVDCKAEMSKTARTANAMKIGFGILGEVKVDDNVNGLDIDTTGKEIRADEIAAHSVTEVMENTVSMRLLHLCMRIEAGIAKFGDLFGQKLDTIGRVTEDDGLVDLELGEKGVEAMHFLSFFDESVVLSNTTEGEFLHEVNLVGRVHVLILEILDDHRESRAKEHDLSVGGHKIEKLFHDRGEFGGKKLVCFVHDEDRAFAEVGNTLAGEIEDTARGTNEDVYGLGKTHDVVFECCATGCDHDVDAHVFSESFTDLGGLKGEFTGGDEEKGLNLVLGDINLL